MYDEHKTSVESDDINELACQLQSGMEEMMRLSKALEEYKKDTLILFIVLSLEPGQIDIVLEVLSSLQELLTLQAK